MLQPSVVELVRAMCSGVAPIRSAIWPRTRPAARARSRTTPCLPAVLLIERQPRLRRCERRARERPERAGVQVREAFENGELGACFLERHCRPHFDRCVIREQPPVRGAPLYRPAYWWRRLEPTHEHVVDPCRGPARKPHWAEVSSASIRELRTQVEVTAEQHGLVGPSDTVDEHGRAQQLSVGNALVGGACEVRVRDDERPV